MPPKKRKRSRKKRKSLLDLRGKIEFAPGYSYKALRSASVDSAGADALTFK